MTLSDVERDCLARLARLMLPGDGQMPSADDIMLAEAPADHVLEVSGHLAAPIRRFLAASRPVEDLAALEDLAQADRDGFDALSVVVANAYFMHPAVRASIGYPGQEARDSSGGLTAKDRSLLEDVRARGPIYRPA